ncbi:hypothetical protein [Altererythrobacter sp. MF3-039]
MSKQLTLSSILAIIAMGGFAMLAQDEQRSDTVQIASTAASAEAGFGS